MLAARRTWSYGGFACSMGLLRLRIATSNLLEIAVFTGIVMSKGNDGEQSADHLLRSESSGYPALEQGPAALFNASALSQPKHRSSALESSSADISMSRSRHSDRQNWKVCPGCLRRHRMSFKDHHSYCLSQTRWIVPGPEGDKVVWIPVGIARSGYRGFACLCSFCATKFDYARGDRHPTVFTHKAALKRHMKRKRAHWVGVEVFKVSDSLRKVPEGRGPPGRPP